MQDSLGVTFSVPDGQEPIPVYEVDGGIEVFVTDEPYLLADTTSLLHPIPVVDAGGPTWEASDGSLQDAWPVSGLEPVVPDDGVTHLGDLVTHNGEIVTHA